MPAKLIASEYNILWKALKHYEKHFQQLPANTKDEDEQLFADKDLMKLEGIFRNLQEAAKQDWDWI